ncbi:polysaccharide pyruvyl transferase family protein [Kocuria flava]|uniref:polysaccharide pyruvyl transferase family protein n=1 Tax=Kocuria flava TaxID=446860 RepID=UPI0015DFABB5|nr:polysaccharide pyruvyl transferase family protein [Kocuria flava]
MKVLIIHAYSADNKGDGLLVEESLRLVREAFGPETEVGLVASYPDSFAYLGCRTYQSRPTSRGFDTAYIKLLLSRAKDYDVIVSVGGGFLRGKKCVELLKTVIVNGPQMCVAFIRGRDSVYLPQSIGPFGIIAIRPFRWFLGRMRAIWLRDDRSVAELGLANTHRSPDLAILGMVRKKKAFNAEAPVVLTVRHVNGKLADDVVALNRLLGQVDSYVQSDVGTNTDVQAVRELGPLSVLTYADLITGNQDSRVVIAVRLHAALMALAAGHYVIHLAYERKGFGAFQDLGLHSYVHNVNNFDANAVMQTVQNLQQHADLRAKYDRQIAVSLQKASSTEALVVESLRASGKLPVA